MGTFCDVCFLSLLLLLLISTTVVATAREEDDSSSEFNIRREDFPREFVFGSGASAYQYEGAAAEDGRTPSIWDTSCHSGYAVIKGTGDIASDGYHMFKEDVKLMANTGLEAYRFSISWSRLLPNGRGAVNPLGLRYYNNFINQLISHGIQPHVTLFHCDHPQVLEDEYEGWLSPKIVDDFTAFANVCFREFGDRVKYWTTLNEPNVFALGGYDQGLTPPERCSYPFGRFNCSVGNSTVEPYIVVHNCLLAHAAVASLYKTKYQGNQHGYIGLNVFVYYFLPRTNSARDRRAAQRAFDFYSGWIVEPLVYGDYPRSMKENVGKKMPSFSVHQRKQLKNSYDFIGINYYAALWVEGGNNNNRTVEERDFMGDLAVKIYPSEQGLQNSMVTSTDKFKSFGLQRALEYFKEAYDNPPIFIHENGYALPRDKSLDDTPRIEYLSAFIGSMLDALRNGSNAKGYFTWSFMDVFELLDGYGSSYGLYYVNFEDGDLKRIPKLSAHWYSSFLKGEGNDIIINNKSSDLSHASI